MSEKRPAEIHATQIHADLDTLLTLVGGRPGAETDEMSARNKLVGRIVSHLQSLVRSMIDEHGHQKYWPELGPTHRPVFGGQEVTWVADASALVRPGKNVSTPMEVLQLAAVALTEAGIPGYSPLNINEGVEALALLLKRTQDQLGTARAAAHQHLEASSHRAQTAEHYRAALQRIADGPSRTDWRSEALAALEAPEWDRKIRP